MEEHPLVIFPQTKTNLFSRTLRSLSFITSQDDTTLIFSLDTWGSCCSLSNTQILAPELCELLIPTVWVTSRGHFWTVWKGNGQCMRRLGRRYVPYPNHLLPWLPWPQLLIPQQGQTLPAMAWWPAPLVADLQPSGPSPPSYNPPNMVLTRWVWPHNAIQRGSSCPQTLISCLPTTPRLQNVWG